MSVESNENNIRRHVDEIWNKGNLDLVPELIAPDHIAHPISGEDTKGLEGFKELVVTSRNAFPDLKFTIESMVAEGDIVAVRYTATATFKNEYMGIKPTGKKVIRKDAIFHRFENGKQVEAWTFYNELDIYRQLGIPLPTR